MASDTGARPRRANANRVCYSFMDQITDDMLDAGVVYQIKDNTRDFPSLAAESTRQKSDEPPPADELFGCDDCAYAHKGCDVCREREPVFVRAHARWQPGRGNPQHDVPLAPVFRPTAEEFRDPLKYVASIREKAQDYGVAGIIPPEGWDPPCPLSDPNKSFSFKIRRQFTSLLCMRKADSMAGVPSEHASVSKQQDAGRIADTSSSAGRVGRMSAMACPVDDDDVFGFEFIERCQSLKSFQAYSDWVKKVHFSPGKAKPPATADSAAAGEAEAPGEGSTAAEAAQLAEPSIEEVEAEFWRVVEKPKDGEAVEALYGQDIDSARYGSGFPLPASRLQPGEAGGRDARTEEYSRHPWNVNNLPRAPGSVLRHVDCDELITGVMVPWLYIGSTMSAFCWHVEDHFMYSINYLHFGAAKVWYGVPASAAEAFEEAMKDAMPHLFSADANLLHRLVTMLSPQQLKARGIPVYRLVHHPGSFVITFPRAYHGGFNAGFNCAEAVNFAPPDWLPFGTDSTVKYRSQVKPLTFSHDALLVSLLSGLRPDSPGAPDAAEADTAPEAKRPRLEVREALAQPHGGHPAASDGVCSEEAARYAAGELAARIHEERRRRSAAQSYGPLQERRMVGHRKCVGSNGVHVNTEDVDCEECGCDLWLSAVVSPAAPGIAYCPQHAAMLPGPVASWILLYRYSVAELQALVDAVVTADSSAEAFVDAAVNRLRLRVEAAPVRRRGPLRGLEGLGPRPGTAEKDNAVLQGVHWWPQDWAAVPELGDEEALAVRPGSHAMRDAAIPQDAAAEDCTLVQLTFMPNPPPHAPGPKLKPPRKLSNSSAHKRPAAAAASKARVAAKPPPSTSQAPPEAELPAEVPVPVVAMASSPADGLDLSMPRWGAPAPAPVAETAAASPAGSCAAVGEAGCAPRRDRLLDHLVPQPEVVRLHHVQYATPPQLQPPAEAGYPPAMQALIQLGLTDACGSGQPRQRAGGERSS